MRARARVRARARILYMLDFYFMEFAVCDLKTRVDAGGKMFIPSEVESYSENRELEDKRRSRSDRDSTVNKPPQVFPRYI